MKRQSTAPYIWLGGNMQFLRYAGANKRIHGEGFIVANLQTLFKRLEELELTVSKELANQIGLPEMLEELERKRNDARLSEAQASKLKRLMRELHQTVIAESMGKSTFIVDQKRWDLTNLIDTPEALFAPGVFSSFDEVVRTDFAEACRCVAFELPTSAAFHLMRATEAVLRTFYRSTVKQNRVDPLLWGPMVNQMRQRRKSPPEPLLNQLDHIRLSFRNPTQHPDAVYDIQQAQDLFGVCIDVIHRMVASTKA